MLISVLFENPIVVFVFVALVLIISISIHEFAHAYTADKLGDPTARYLGRVTLNPLAHLDPIGTIMLLFVGFGWGKPVPFNPINLSNPKRDAAIISIAGPMSNFILAVIFSIIFKVVSATGLENLILAKIFFPIIFYNLILGVFNLIPIHPLDGFKVVNGLLPTKLSIQWMQMEQFGIILLLVLVFTRTIGNIIMPVVSFLLSLLGISQELLNIFL